MSKQPKSTKRDGYTIVLEDLRAKFEVFGEGLNHLNRKFDDQHQIFGGFEQRLDRLELKMDVGFLHLEQRMGSLESGFCEFKEGSKIGHKQLENHENRIVTLENILLTKS